MFLLPRALDRCDAGRPAADELETTLRRLAMLLPDDKTVWDDNELVCIAVERLWIYAGTTAEAYRGTAELDRGDQPWSELYEFRNILAHWTPGQANTARVTHLAGRAAPVSFAVVLRA